MNTSTNALVQVGAEISGTISDYTGDILIIIGEIFCLAGFVLAFWLIVRQIDKIGS